MIKLTAFTYYLFALGCGIAMINQSVYYSMLFGGIAIINFLLFNLFSAAE